VIRGYYPPEIPFLLLVLQREPFKLQNFHISDNPRITQVTKVVAGEIGRVPESFAVTCHFYKNCVYNHDSWVPSHSNFSYEYEQVKLHSQYYGLERTMISTTFILRGSV